MYPKPDLTLRYMSTQDISQVMEIDHQSFDIPWAENSYRYEIQESNHSFMVVLESHQERPASRWQRWFGIGGTVDHQIGGYGGMWNVIGEAHISTIAVHPRARGRGWGEILLAGMIRRSIMLEAEMVALEVRVSNYRAQNLYRKFGFETASIKAKYYRNNNEDAYDMRLRIGKEDVRKRFEERYAAILVSHMFNDCFSENSPEHSTTQLF
ncbi:MAG: ribosomal protein S18-alanine N-acetyltransferase [Anaerolineae bacterium]